MGRERSSIVASGQVVAVAWSVGTASDARPEATGRVHVLMLSDGKPFEGGHVCFFRDEHFVEPGPWDGVSGSDGAYLGMSLQTPLWPNFDPVLGSGASVPGFENVRGITDSEGRVTIDVPAGRRLVTFVRYAMSGIPLVSQPRVELAEGAETDITIEAARMRAVTGRCVDDRGRPLAGVWVQAVAPDAERPLSRKVETSEAGAFRLEVFGEDAEVRVRAVPPYFERPLGICDTAEEIPPIPGDTTVAGVVPDGEPVEIRMRDAPVVLMDVAAADGDTGFASHLQVEGLAFDPRAGAWVRLGGPRYSGNARRPTGRFVVALPRTEAVRPLKIWSWGWTLTVVDPRGASRIAVEIPRGRRASVRGRGWKDGDRLRVVCFFSPAGEEPPGVWIDGVVGAAGKWARDDAPPSAIEFQIVRDGVVVGRSERVPPGSGPAAEVSIDLE